MDLTPDVIAASMPTIEADYKQMLAMKRKLTRQKGLGFKEVAESTRSLRSTFMKADRKNKDSVLEDMMEPLKKKRK